MCADESALLDVGRIVKAQGLKGQVLVSLTTDRTERLKPDTVLFTTRGTLTVRTSSPHQNCFIVAFAEISDRSEAERWRGVTLRATRLHDESVIWIDDLFGALVVSKDGVSRGVVVSIEQNPASDLMVLDSGALVPLTFVTAVTPRERVVVDVPDGLFE